MYVQDQSNMASLSKLFFSDALQVRFGEKILSNPLVYLLSTVDGLVCLTFFLSLQDLYRLNKTKYKQNEDEQRKRFVKGQREQPEAEYRSANICGGE